MQGLDFLLLLIEINNASTKKHYFCDFYSAWFLRDFAWQSRAHTVSSVILRDFLSSGYGEKSSHGCKKPTGSCGLALRYH